MKRRLAVVFAVLTFSSVSAQQQHAVIKLTAEKLHARVREWPYPANGVTVPTNAPALQWPASNGTTMVLPMESDSAVPEDPNIGNVRYQVVLASDKNFLKDVIKSGIQEWAVYPLHQALKPGKWYWKYAFALKGNKQWKWSEVYDFSVDARYASAKVSPPVAEVLKRNGGPHPRLWSMNRIEKEFYQKNLDNPEAKALVALARKLMKAPLPVEKPRRSLDTTGKTAVQKKIMMTRMYHGFGDQEGTPVRNLCIAYQLTKDKQFIEDAKRRAMILARMDPNGLATRDDFNGGAILEALAWFYDAGYDFLTEEERVLLRDVITVRAKRIYDHLPNRFEVHVSENHIWQITMRNLAIGTVAVMNEVPEAAKWLTYLYEVWSARFPVLGTTDGGWHEGTGYFKVNFRSIIYLSQLFGDFSGVDYFKLPWMQNLPYYLLYTHPPASASISTGDSWENMPDVTKSEAWFAEALALKVENPYLNWYVAQIKTRNPDFFKGTDDYLFFRLLNYNPGRKMLAASPKNLPATREFKDVGVVAMHENLSNAGNSLSSYLLSSPFGSSGHGHASQNAFTVNYKGKTIFGATGYYSNFSDKHNLLYYRASKAYCTILADSLNQKLGEEGYGWTARSINGNHIQYGLGDASNAYGEIKSEFWLNRFDQIKLKPAPVNGYGDAGVTLYRRHMLQLDGGYILLYDELEAKKPVKWTTLFHTPYYTIEAGATDNAKQQNFAVKTDLGTVNASVFAHAPLGMIVHNQFFEKPLNWNGITDETGNLAKFEDQWHAGITSQPAQKFRFLTIIQVKEGKAEVIKSTGETDGLLKLQVGNWNIQAQLDGNRPAAVQVNNAILKSVFNYGNLTVNFDGKTYKNEVRGSSMLLETKGSKLNRKEVVDELPGVAKYDFE
ncbi:DUF4962 domain-containing protein [Pedobacter heparinus]|uniref:Uncharacterized protein n=1 Tax=Pedobacter heparinus (strain ATCC 13125 / DSM 2366 / CIP 104194 / JCM 7457 / NBRC 12017 / NCIMB 9290 / NRRL B-14731 / HIM 762-3) TaxID=485917 RepID=C6Y1P0_PEDHD|nr:DUF4962 domain-containing protein [Pedobacter heparinus]ACU05032.1 hypothetical protein Phep_2833 [Pedobacter heparinus DSM 2366]